MRGIRFWLISLVSFVTILSGTLFFPAMAKIPGNQAISPPQEFGQITASRPVVIAFKPNLTEQGHQFITKSMLNGIWTAVDTSPITDEDGKPLGFTSEAIEEIYQGNRGVDLKPGSDIFTSEDFDVPENHFDNELFERGSTRLQRLKQGVVDALRAVKPTEDCNCSPNSDNNADAEAGKAARKLLGQALHSLQDFYAHTNWVELGFRGAEIDTRLGRSIVPNPPAGFTPAQSGDPGTLNPALVGTRDINSLTSGYFVSLTSLCKAPSGKMRHGAPIVCSNGLNKDKNDRPGYAEAELLALVATKDFVNQIIVEDPEIRGNIPRIKALMGIRTPCPTDRPKPPECQQRGGRSYGDPHIATIDGFSYSLQTVGESILIQSNDGAFAVQARHSAFSSSMSLNTAVAVKAGRDRVALYTREMPDGDTRTPWRLNGKPITLQTDQLSLPGGGSIAKQGSDYVIHVPSGENVVLSPRSEGDRAFLNISPFVYSRSGKYSGLLGNVNGNPKDDLQIRGGSSVSATRSSYGDVKQVLNLVGLRVPGALDTAEKLYFDNLYKQFANSWQIKPTESLFDYPSGKTTKNYTDPAFPDRYLTLNMLSTNQVEQAQKACTQANVTEDLMEGCIFDVGFSGFSEFARATAEINGYISLVNQLVPGVNIPTPEQAVNRIIENVKPRVCLPFVGCL
jgi:von Willebrand factor type D domain/Heterokaryon incompatibility protein Het-C